ncbi:hypothetical protein ACJJTC_019527 [Scirpophaga incertulas]
MNSDRGRGWVATRKSAKCIHPQAKEGKLLFTCYSRNFGAEQRKSLQTNFHYLERFVEEISLSSGKSTEGSVNGSGRGINLAGPERVLNHLAWCGSRRATSVRHVRPAPPPAARLSCRDKGDLGRL